MAGSEIVKNSHYNHFFSKLNSLEVTHFDDHSVHYSLSLLTKMYFEKIKTTFQDWRANNPSEFDEYPDEIAFWDELVVLKLPDLKVFYRNSVDIPDSVELNFVYSERSTDIVNYLLDARTIVKKYCGKILASGFVRGDLYLHMETEECSFKAISWLGGDYYLFLNNRDASLNNIRSHTPLGFNTCLRLSQQMISFVSDLYVYREKLVEHEIAN